MTSLSIALAHAEAGLPTFPAKVFWNGTKWRKRPLVRWRNGASTNAILIGLWWREFPSALPAIELSRAGLVVLDADRHGGPDGVEALVALGELPSHPIVLTPSGEHHVFRQPVPMLGNRTGNLPSGIDVRGAGGWIVAPGAVRPDGARWEGDIIGPFRSGTIPVLPGHIVELIGSSGSSGPSGLQTSRRVTSIDLPTWREALANHRKTAKRWSREESFALASLDYAMDRVMRAPDHREETLNGETFAIGRLVGAGWIELSRAAFGMFAAARAAGFPDCDEVRKKILRALHDGMARPYPPLNTREVTREERSKPEARP
jgi:hypothetical protein